jgi:hypothetical protein
MHRPWSVRFILVTVALAGLTLAGCYEPRYRECAVRCASAEDCAPTHVCGDGWCVVPGERADTCVREDGPASDARLVDAALDAVAPVAIDAALVVDGAVVVDAPEVSGCDPLCRGACQQGVCVIACMDDRACNGDIVCPPSGPCRVVCQGKESCGGEVRCGGGPCAVQCSGNRACAGGVRCGGACACDVTCSGNDACGDGARCSADTCRTSKGCSSAPEGCSAC